jgi:hypothetical protein
MRFTITSAIVFASLALADFHIIGINPDDPNDTQLALLGSSADSLENKCAQSINANTAQPVPGPSGIAFFPVGSFPAVIQAGNGTGLLTQPAFELNNICGGANLGFSNQGNNAWSKSFKYMIQFKYLLY